MFTYPVSFLKAFCAPLQNTNVTWPSSAGTSEQDIIPLDPFYNYYFAAFLLTPAELGSAKQITNIQIQVGSSYNISKANTTVRVYHTSETVMPTNANLDTNLKTTLNGTDEVVVLNNGTFTISGSEPDYISPFTWAENFCYNGNDSLVYQVECKTGSYTASTNTWQGTVFNSPNNNRSCYGYSDESWAEVTNVTRSSFRPNVKIYY
tara:strand:+ start:333 stop:950 length:618 start_codon:yes stop_codon:yes gene_type:complete